MEDAATKSFPSFQQIDLVPKSRLERLMSYMADVRGGEGVTASLLTLNIFLLLSAYYILKTVREALILTEGGAEIKSYSAAGQALLLLFIVPAYSAFASRVNRIRLIDGISLFFVSNLIAFYLVGRAGVKEGIAFFLWLGIFNVFAIAQFWAFANDLYTERQGKRLFPVIGIGSSLGAWLGASTAARLIENFGAHVLMLIAAAVIIGCVFLTSVVNRRESGKEKNGRHAQQPLGKESGFQLILADRYLLLIAILTVLLNVVNSTGEFLLGKLVVAEAAKLAPAEQQRFVGSFYGQFFSWVNLTGFLLQTFFVSRIFHFAGVRGALFVLPCIALGGYSLMFVWPALQFVRLVKIAENSVDYSIQTTARQALYLPTSREAKYKAKTAIDTLFMRGGDVLQAGIVWLGVKLALTVSMFAFFNVGLTVLWLAVVVALSKEHRRRVRSVASLQAGSPRSGSTATVRP